MRYRRTDNGVEQTAEPGSALAGVLDADPKWAQVEEGGQAATSTSKLPALSRLTRAELDTIARDAGVDKPESLSSKAKVVAAIRDAQGE